MLYLLLRPRKISKVHFFPLWSYPFLRESDFPFHNSVRQVSLELRSCGQFVLFTVRLKLPILTFFPWSLLILNAFGKIYKAFKCFILISKKQGSKCTKSSHSQYQSNKFFLRDLNWSKNVKVKQLKWSAGGAYTIYLE